jgi:putative NIF3 family GTP cyclohydrolase 1 type 2
MTIGEFIVAMKAAWEGGWRETAIDVLLYGDSGRELDGVAVAMMATQEVLESAAARGCNLIITHEPLFYSHQDSRDFLKDDPVYRAKRDFLDEHRLCVFHLHDNLHRPIDRINRGMAIRLGWEGYRVDDRYQAFRLQPKGLVDLARELRASLGPSALRYVGDPSFTFEHVVTSWGFMMAENAVKLVNAYDSCVLVTGETHEWEFVEYARDAGRLGFRKALVVVGHICSEEGAVEVFHSDLRSLFPDSRVEFIATGDLFARPEEA